MRRVVLACVASILVGLATGVVDAQELPGPQGPETGASRRQLWFLPIPGERLLMHAIVMRPPGPGPFPLAVINHGSIQAAQMREKYPLREYPILS